MVALAVKPTQEALHQSVQKRDMYGSVLGDGSGYILTRSNQLLSPRGTRRRDLELRALYYDDNISIVASVASGLVKRIQSTPWKITGEDSQRWQEMLMEAEFGAGWSVFISRLLIPYFRADTGGFYEIIGPGEPDAPLVAAPTAIASLNGISCQPTGDPVYPVIYYGNGGWHKMHRTRVVQLADSIDSDYLGLVGYGQCALSRYVAAAIREKFMNLYIATYLDDKPLPGFLTFKNLTKGQVEASMNAMLADMEKDAPGVWGRTIVLTDISPDNPSGVEFFSVSSAPEKFDFETYTNLDVKLAALAFNVDIQEIWELSGGNLGSGAQSEILNQKSKGKTLGLLMTEIERTINQALPREASFVFEREDVEEDAKRVAVANGWAGFTVTAAQVLNPAIQSQLLIDNVPEVAEAMRNLETMQKPLTDADPESGQQQVELPADDAREESEAQIEQDKAYGSTRATFTDEFMRAFAVATTPYYGRGVARVYVLQALRKAGEAEYLQGMRDAGETDPTLSAEDEQKLATWLQDQVGYVDKLTADMTATEMTPTQAQYRAGLWVNKSLRAAYWQGLDAATPGGRLVKWVVSPPKDHCRTCKALDGQIHRLRTFLRRNLYPGSSACECGGYQCGCEFVDVPKGTRAYGNIRRVPYIRGAKEHVH